MAFAKLIFKASKLQRLQKILHDEKQRSVALHERKVPKTNPHQKYRNFWIDVRTSLKKKIKKVFACSKKSFLHKLAYKTTHDGTCENFILKSVLGFMGGFFLTYIFFMFFVLQLNFKLSTATIMCSIVGCILTIGLAFSYKVRCIVFLLLPQFFSKRGRQALLAYAFILAITGPAKNTLHNMGILSESLACGQEQLKSAVKQLVEAIKKPFYAIKDAIKAVVQSIRDVVRKIKEILLAIKRIVLALLKVIKSAFEFLGRIFSVCNKELGTPFQRCTKVFEEAVVDCNAKLGPMFSWLCSITYLVQSVCYIVKFFDFICLIVDFVSDSIIGVVLKKIKIFTRHIRTMFYVRIKFSHSFHFETNQSKSVSEVTAGIVTEIRQRTEQFMAVFDFMSCATSLFFFVIILRVMHYRYQFLTSERFDNRFITKDFRIIDMRRAQMEKETILPLNHRERSLYISMSSLRLVRSEKLKLFKAAIALGMVTLKLSTHMMVDYALYWVLMTIRYHARFQSGVQVPSTVGLHIEGKGFIADLLKSIVKAFQPFGTNLEIDTIPCLPDPIPPDYDRYIQIASLLVLSWILTVFEPYGLRLRHSVMSYYHPERARERAVWLYNHIMRSRLSFLKFARRQLRRRAKGSKEVTLKEHLRANIKWKWMRMCLGSDAQSACLLCGEVFRKDNASKAINCSKPSCPGVYCEQCFADLKNLCTICLEPIQYGDISDNSEEKDSSEEEEHSLRSKSKEVKRKIKKEISNGSDDESKALITLLSKKGFDSDYTSGSDSNDSFAYQKIKDLSAEPEPQVLKRHKDVEKQSIPDHASLAEFKKFFSDSEDSTREEELKSIISQQSTQEVCKCEICKSDFKTNQSNVTLENSKDIKCCAVCKKKPKFLTKSSLTKSFKKNVKYDVINESPRSSITARTKTTSFSSSSSENRSPLNINYEIYVPQLEKFIDCTDLLQRNNSNTLREEQRKKRSAEMQKTNLQNNNHNSSSGASKKTESSTYDTECQKARHKKKIKDYYKKINQNMSFSTNQSPKKSPTLLEFFKQLFLKAKGEDVSVNNSPHEFPLLISSKENTSGTPSRFESSKSTSSGEKFLLEDSLRTSTRSSQSSLMGSVGSFGRSGAESYTFEESRTLSQVTKSRRSENNPIRDLNSSDSDLTDLDIYFGVTGRISKTRSFGSEKRKHEITNKSEKETTKSESTPRYLRQPAERDEDPLSSKMAENFQSGDLNTRYLEDVRGNDCDNRYIANRGRCCSCPLNQEVIKRDHKSSNQMQRVQSPCYVREAPPPPPPPRRRPRTCVERPQHHCLNRSRTTKNEKRCSSPHTPRCCPRTDYYTPEGSYNYPYNYPTDSEPSEAPEHPEGSEDDYNRCHDHYYPCQNYESPNRKKPEDQTSCCSEYSGHSEFPELVYQHTDEFLDVVDELGDILSMRNKNRVETTIREFEYMSKQNKNLDHPIFEEEFDNQSQNRCHCLLCYPHSNIKKHRHELKYPKASCYRYEGEESMGMYPKDVPRMPETNYYQEPFNARWHKDQRSGKWYKIKDDYGDRYEGEDYRSPSPCKPVHPPKKTSRRCVTKQSSPDRSAMKCFTSSPPPPNCRCNNCRYRKETKY